METSSSVISLLLSRILSFTSYSPAKPSDEYRVVETDIQTAFEFTRAARSTYIESGVIFEGDITPDNPLESPVGFDSANADSKPLSGDGNFSVHHNAETDLFEVSFTATEEKAGEYAGEYTITETDYDCVPTVGGYNSNTNEKE